MEVGLFNDGASKQKHRSNDVEDEPFPKRKQLKSQFEDKDRYDSVLEWLQSNPVKQFDEFAIDGSTFDWYEEFYRTESGNNASKVTIREMIEMQSEYGIYHEFKLIGSKRLSSNQYPAKPLIETPQKPRQAKGKRAVVMTIKTD